MKPHDKDKQGTPWRREGVCCQGEMRVERILQRLGVWAVQGQVKRTRALRNQPLVIATSRENAALPSSPSFITALNIPLAIKAKGPKTAKG